MHAAPEVRFSSRHNGLALYLGRLLRAIWKERILNSSPVTEATYSQKSLVLVSAIDITSLLETKENLEALNRFLLENKFFTAIPSEGDSASVSRVGAAMDRMDEDAQRAEQQSLFDLHSLLLQSIEAIQFVLLLIDHDIDSLLETYVTTIFIFIVCRLPTLNQAELRELTYENLVVSDNGREIAKLLIDTLINKQVGNNFSVDTISEMLRQKCSTFCSPDDVTLYKGVEHLQLASHVASQMEKNDHLVESLRLFSIITESLEFSKLEEIVASYKTLKYRAGIVNLVLLVAKKSDPSNLGLIYVKSGQQPGNDLRSEEAYKKRLQFYSLIFDQISSLEDNLQGNGPFFNRNSEPEKSHAMEELYELMLSSDDKVFHYCLYEWLIVNGYRDHVVMVCSFGC